MSNLPLECIAKVIEWIDSPHDLFNLLTVSKDVFSIAVRRLYHDPLQTYPKLNDHNVLKLITLLLSLSPATGENIDMIRQSLGSPPSGTPLNPQPMINYLSLVKVIRWGESFYDEYNVSWLNHKLGWQLRDIHLHLTWAFAGHRLDEIEELEINADDRERYLNNVAKMTRLHKIWICIGNDDNYMAMYDFAEAMVKAIHFHHGLYHLTECHMVPNPLVRGPSTEYDNHGPPFDLNHARRILSLLPPPRHYLTLPRPDGSTVLLNQLFDPCMATIQHVNCHVSEDFDYTWVSMVKAYPDQSPAQILQRFRGMTSLNIYSMIDTSNDENLLAWAACEAEHYYQQPGGNRFAPLVPLKMLHIDYTRLVSPKWKILQDGLLGFSGSLNCLRVTYPQSDDGMVDRVFTIPRTMLNLKSLTLSGLAIDRSVWERVPNIEHLKITFSFPRSRFRPADPTTTTTTAEQQNQRQLPEFWIHCPKLTRLELYDRAINLFDPNCLRFSPNLQQILLTSPIVRDHEHTIDCSVDSCEVYAARKVLRPTRWTWDWSFPVLQTLELKGDLHEFRFSMAILRSYPTLKAIDLYHCYADNRFPLRAREIFDGPLDKNTNQVQPFTHSNLKSIALYGSWDIERDELACLLQVLPGLMEIVFGFVHFDEGFGNRDLIEITKAHPALLNVVTHMALTTEPPSALGLSPNTSPNSFAVVRYLGSSRGLRVAEMPKERTSIIYTFKDNKRYNLLLS